MTDPLVTVSRIASEGILLVVSHHFKKHSSEPNGPPNVVTCAELFVFLLRVQDQGGEEREKHPHTCTEKMMLYAMYHEGIDYSSCMIIMRLVIVQYVCITIVNHPSTHEYMNSSESVYF